MTREKDTLYCENPPAHSERELYKFEIPETVFVALNKLQPDLTSKGVVVADETLPEH
jgi:hypothetical protein